MGAIEGGWWGFVRPPRVPSVFPTPSSRSAALTANTVVSSASARRSAAGCLPGPGDQTPGLRDVRVGGDGERSTSFVEREEDVVAVAGLGHAVRDQEQGLAGTRGTRYTGGGPRRARSSPRPRGRASPGGRDRTPRGRHQREFVAEVHDLQARGGARGRGRRPVPRSRSGPRPVPGAARSLRIRTLRWGPSAPPAVRRRRQRGSWYADSRNVPSSAAAASTAASPLPWTSPRRTRVPCRPVWMS